MREPQTGGNQRSGDVRADPVPYFWETQETQRKETEDEEVRINIEKMNKKIDQLALAYSSGVTGPDKGGDQIESHSIFEPNSPQFARPNPEAPVTWDKMLNSFLKAQFEFFSSYDYKSGERSDMISFDKWGSRYRKGGGPSNYGGPMERKQYGPRPMTQPPPNAYNRSQSQHPLNAYGRNPSQELPNGFNRINPQGSQEYQQYPGRVFPRPKRIRFSEYIKGAGQAEASFGAGNGRGQRDGTDRTPRQARFGDFKERGDGDDRKNSYMFKRNREEDGGKSGNAPGLLPASIEENTPVEGAQEASQFKPMPPISQLN